MEHFVVMLLFEIKSSYDKNKIDYKIISKIICCQSTYTTLFVASLMNIKNIHLHVYIDCYKYVQEVGIYSTMLFVSIKTSTSILV